MAIGYCTNGTTTCPRAISSIPPITIIIFNKNAFLPHHTTSFSSYYKISIPHPTIAKRLIYIIASSQHINPQAKPQRPNKPLDQLNL